MISAESVLSFFSSAEITSKIFNALILIDSDRKILKTNDSFHKFLGRTPEGTPGLSFDGFIEDPQAYIQLLNKFKDAPESAFDAELNLMPQKNTPIPFKATTLKVENGSFLLICENILTNRQLTNKIHEIKSLTKKLKESGDEIKNSIKAKDEFIAGVSHEMKTPMAGISECAEKLLKTKLTDVQREQVQCIKISNDMLFSITENLLDFSNIESGKITIDSSEYNFEQIICEVISVANVEASLKNINLLYSIDPMIRNNVYVDAKRLRQVIFNLTKNAIKYTENGCVNIKAVVEYETRDEIRIRTEILAEGIGIEASMLEKIFSPFFQASFENDDTAGAGLGLTIANNIVRLMGGKRIFVESTAGKGSNFHFSLNLKKGRPVANLDPQEKIEKAAAKAKQPQYKILLVEDNASNAELIIEILSNICGHDIKWVENGLLATNAVKDENFDLVLMDIQMPVMDGKEATRRMRKYGVTTPIIALTASVMPRDYDECMECGMDAYASKPINIHKLEKMIIEVVESRKAVNNPVQAAADAAVKAL